MNLKFRTKAACRIARINPQRFNEDVAAGLYPCAPPTRAGVSRAFDKADLCGLTLYYHLTNVYSPNQFSKSIAASYACQVIDAVHEMDRNGGDRADFPLNGFNDTYSLREATDAPSFGRDNGHTVGSAFAATMCFDLRSIVEYVEKRMEEEAQILGEED